MRWNLLRLTACQSLMSRLQSVARFNSVCVEKDHFSFDPFGSFGNLWYLIVISLHYQCKCQHFSLVQDCKDRPRGRESHRPYEGAGRCREVFVVMSCHLVISRHISLCCGGVVCAGGVEVGHSWGEHQGLRMRG